MVRHCTLTPGSNFSQKKGFDEFRPYPVPGVGSFCLELTMEKKIVSNDELKLICDNARKNNQKIVFTNGCFDLLHVGHIRYLRKASSLGDILVVGINSNSSVTLIKGPKRPLVDESARAEIVSSLYCVDYVTLFNEPDPLNLIEIVRPDVLVKGSDWPENKIVGADLVKRHGGKVVRIELTPGVSTSKIIETITDRYC